MKRAEDRWDNLQTDYRLFFIKGVVDFTINGETFTVDEEALVRSRRSKILDRMQGGLRVYDLDCPDSHSMLEELGDHADRAPKDPASSLLSRKNSDAPSPHMRMTGMSCLPNKYGFPAFPGA